MDKGILRKRMSKLVALKSGSYELLPDAWNSDFSSLKQQALLFNQIGIYKLSNFYKTLEESTDLFKQLVPNSPDKAESITAELEWLQQNGIIYELKVEDELSESQLRLLNTNVGQNYEEAKKLLMKLIEIPPSDLEKTRDEARRRVLIKEQHFTLLRLLSIIMETTKGVTAVTTLPYMEYTRELPASSKSNVVQVVINNLPLPSNETSWEQIIDYRNDSETQKHLLSLRRWINKISTQNLSSLEIEEEIASLINDFQEHMKFHKMKANTETVEVIIKAPLEVLELQFSKILEPFIALKKRQINLMEAELNAPGKEMAYIIKTRDTFQSLE